MPTYSYRCNQCQQVFALSHGMLESMVPICAQCGHFATRLVGSAPPIVGGFKNSSHEPTTEDTASEQHQCHGACVLHRNQRLTGQSGPGPDFT